MDYMKRRELLARSSALVGFGTASLALPIGKSGATEASGESKTKPAEKTQMSRPNPLIPPASGTIPVAFAISDGAAIIDFCGPWEVFQDAQTIQGQLFNLYTVAGTTEPVKARGGMTIVPTYSFQTAPPPKVIVIPAQNGANDAMLDWIRASTKASDLTMSVCTGAFVLARTGLLAGKAATTHHAAYADFEIEFPDISLKRGARFVEEGNLASAGGLSSGIDLALRVVERYYGREKAVQTADMMEYQGQGWLNPDSNQAYTKARVSTEAHPVCPVCSMDANHDLKSLYQGKVYYFCSQGHKELFDKTPDKFTAAR
jgi:putative intracellular protease/amidase/YHS domain-containing protein